MFKFKPEFKPVFGKHIYHWQDLSLWTWRRNGPVFEFWLGRLYIGWIFSWAKNGQ